MTSAFSKFVGGSREVVTEKTVITPPAPPPAPARAAPAEGMEGYDAADYQPGSYQPFTTGRKLPGFSVALADGQRFWIFYHNIGSLKFIEKNGFDHLAFTHQGTAITIQGRELLTLFNLMGEGRLKGVFEPSNMPSGRPQPGQVVITEIRVDEPPSRAGLSLVK